jgi:hypothetical protein
MKANVSSVASVNSNRAATVVEYAQLLAPIVGKTVSPDVPNATLVSDYISMLIVQFGFNTLSATYAVEKDDAALNPTMTLEQAGVVEGDALKFRVILALA